MVDFRIESEFGDEAFWVKRYLADVSSVLVSLMDNPDVTPPSAIRAILRRDASVPGISGRASGAGLEFSSNQWPAEPTRRWILAHELVNLFCRHYGGGGGYPSDWWSNGRSPFPEYASCLVMAAAGYPNDARLRRAVHEGKPDHDLYWKLHDRFGFVVFARFFKFLRADQIDLAAIGAPWPKADARRSLYAIAYLSIATGENLAPRIREAGVGKEPSDWRKIRPDCPFQEYVISDADVTRVIDAREAIFGGRGFDQALEPRRAAFRRGIYEASPS